MRCRSLFAAACLFLLPVLAQAHAVLLDSSPKSGEMLATSPKEVTATFNESVGPIFFRILDTAGQEVGKPGEIRLDGARMILPLNDSLPNGTYLLTYRVISADTHPVGTTFGFSIGEPMRATSTASAASDTRSKWSTLVGVNRWVLYASMLWAAGSVLFLLALSPPSAIATKSMRSGRLAALSSAITFVLAIGFGGADMRLAGLDGLWSAESWRTGLGSTLAASATLGVPGMLLLMVALSSGDRPRAGLAVAGTALAIGSFLITGHAATAPPAWLMAPIVGLHLVATAFWLAALLPLRHAARVLPASEAGELMDRFSRYAVPAVGVVLLSGVAISWRQLGSPLRLVDNPYGLVLATKLALFVCIVGIAAYNKKALTPQLGLGIAGADARIRRTIGVELLIYFAVLLAAAGLTLTTPPRAIVAGAAPGAAAAMNADGAWRKSVKDAAGYSVDLELSPAKAGQNMLMATLKDRDGKPITNAAALDIVVSLPAAGISDVRLKGQDVGNGMWHVMIEEMLIPGEWKLAVEAFVTDYDKSTFETTVPIG